MALVQITSVASNGQPNAKTRYVNASFVQSVRAAYPEEIAAYPTALTAITVNYTNYNQPATVTYLVATATATVAAAVSAAQAGVLGVSVSGDATLVAGTVNVAIPGLTTSSKIVLTRHTAGGTVTSTVEYFYVVTANQLTITAAVAAGTINTADTSVITYAVVG